MKRGMVGWILLLALAVVLLEPGAAACCGACDGSGRQVADADAKGARGGCGWRFGQDQAAGRGMRGEAGMSHHGNIHGLLDRHEAIDRSVQEIAGGVETVTTSDDPEVTGMIREHVRQMQQRMESGFGVRHWDPLFVELFRHHAEIEMVIEDVPGGVRVRETSESADVTELIRQHAVRGVSEFVAGGHERARQPTPLPERRTCPGEAGS